MNRITVYDYGEGRRVAGWFDRGRADAYGEATRWEGNNNVSVATGRQWDHEVLYRTAQGRWVLHAWSQWQGSTPTWRFVVEDQARDWLVSNEHQHIDELFDVPAERGPGQPPIGPEIKVRLGSDLQPRVEGWAARHDVTRAEAVRKLVAAGLEDIDDQTT